MRLLPLLTVVAPPAPSCTQVVCAMKTLWLRLDSRLSWCWPITRLVSPCMWHRQGTVLQ
jgi:hypothetical protein